MSKRVCPVVGCPTLIDPRDIACTKHKAERERARGSRQARGYDAAHDRLRADWQRRIDSGEDVRCADGCGTRIIGRGWDLGHTPDRTAYVGPMTERCNRADGGRRSHL